MAARKSKINQAWNDLPAGIQIAIILAGGLAVFYGGRSIVRAVRSAGQSAGIQAGTTADLLALQTAGQSPTYMDSQYDQLASKLWYAMDSDWYNPFSWGTSDSQVFQVFQALRNDADFVKLKQAFGIKDGYDMQAWLAGDMSTSELTEINNILSAKGITYRV